jgi:hypothetical protein
MPTGRERERETSENDFRSVSSLGALHVQTTLKICLIIHQNFNFVTICIGLPHSESIVGTCVEYEPPDWVEIGFQATWDRTIRLPHHCNSLGKSSPSSLPTRFNIIGLVALQGQ